MPTTIRSRFRIQFHRRMPMTLSAIPADTSAEAARVQVEIFRRFSGEQRLRKTLEMSDAIRAITADGVRHHHPEYTDEQVRLTVIRRILGDELFLRAYPN